MCNSYIEVKNTSEATSEILIKITGMFIDSDNDSENRSRPTIYYCNTISAYLVINIAKSLSVGEIEQYKSQIRNTADLQRLLENNIIPNLNEELLQIYSSCTRTPIASGLEPGSHVTPVTTVINRLFWNTVARKLPDFTGFYPLKIELLMNGKSDSDGLMNLSVCSQGIGLSCYTQEDLIESKLRFMVTESLNHLTEPEELQILHDLKNKNTVLNMKDVISAADDAMCRVAFDNSLESMLILSSQNHGVYIEGEKNITTSNTDMNVCRELLGHLSGLKRGTHGGKKINEKKYSLVGGGKDDYIKINNQFYKIEFLLDIINKNDKLSYNLKIVLMNIFLEYYYEPTKDFILYETSDGSKFQVIKLTQIFNQIYSNLNLSMDFAIFSINKNGNEGKIDELTIDVTKTLDAILVENAGSGIAPTSATEEDDEELINLDSSASAISNLATNSNFVQNTLTNSTSRPQTPIKVNGGSKKRKRSKSKNKKTIKKNKKNKNKKKSLKKIKKKNKKPTLKK